MNDMNESTDFGAEEYQIAKRLLPIILKEVPNPTYRKIEKIAECMLDLAKDERIFVESELVDNLAPRPEYCKLGKHCGRDKRGIWHCECINENKPKR